jgi:dCTP deaminase
MTDPFELKLRQAVSRRAIRFKEHVIACLDASAHRKGSPDARRSSLHANILVRLEAIEKGAETLGIDDLFRLLEELQKIHETNLPTLPSIDVPIELQSFIRQTQLPSARPFQVHGSDYLGDSVAILPIPNSELDRLRSALNALENSPSNEAETGDLRLPRMDLCVPGRWASLIHEKEHSSAHEDVRAFVMWAGESLYASMKHELISFLGSDSENIETIFLHWITEIVCDIRAFHNIGPAIFFAQFYAFEGDIGYCTLPDSRFTTHPPPTLRLKLLRDLTSHRFLFSDRRLKKDLLDRIDFHIRYFQWFIRKVRAQPHANLPLLRKSLVAWRQLEGSKSELHLSLEEAEYLKDRLSIGEPIPSLEDGGIASIESILLGGCMSDVDGAATLPMDEALRRSIQLREWLLVLGGSQEPFREPGQSSSLAFTGVAADWRIRQLMDRKDDALRIVPLLDRDLQIGSASIDLRLGQYFQEFSEGPRGLVDLLPAKEYQPKSRELSFDVGEGVIISPGKFLLGHTLEFIRLPSDVCGQIEGRSSFGRLGIQIHMTANLIDAGFTGVITLEILNMGPEPVKIYPGTRIAQLRLFMMEVPQRPYSGRDKYGGRYRHNISRQTLDKELDALVKFREVQGMRNDP